MNHNNITLTDYRAVLILSQTGSFRATSEQMGLSPSALSRQISTLEIRLGTRLFDRDTRNVELTATGQVLAELAEQMINAANGAAADLDTYLSARRGRLTIAGLPSVTSGLLPDLFGGFTEQHPEIDLKIMDDLSGNVLDAVDAGLADLGFTAGTPMLRPSLSFDPLFDDEFVAIGAPDGPLQVDRTYGWAELASMPFITMSKGTSVRELIDSACLRHGVTISARFEVSQLATAGAFVAKGLGITALPALTLPILRMDRLIRRPILDFGLRRRIGLVRRIGRSPSPAAQAFLNYTKTNISNDLQLRDAKTAILGS